MSHYTHGVEDPVGSAVQGVGDPEGSAVQGIEDHVGSAIQGVEDPVGSAVQGSWWQLLACDSGSLEPSAPIYIAHFSL